MLINFPVFTIDVCSGHTSLAWSDVIAIKTIQGGIRACVVVVHYERPVGLGQEKQRQ